MNPADLDVVLRSLFLFIGIVLGGSIVIGLVFLIFTRWGDRL